MQSSSKRTLPILDLDNLSIAKACHAVWDNMTPVDGGDKARHCGACDKNVYRIAAMSRAEATALIMKHEGRVCLRMARRSDGTVITNDCPVGVATWRKHIARVSAAAAAVFGVLVSVGAMFRQESVTMGAPMPIDTSAVVPVTPVVVTPVVMPEHEVMGELPMMEPVAKPKPKSRRAPPPKRHEEQGEIMGDVAGPFEGAAS